MSLSLPSARTIIADVPEVKNFRAKFNYNFFQPDERTNSSGKATAEFIQKKPSESFDANYQNSSQFNRFTSRYVSLTWKPSVDSSTAATFSPPGFKIASNIDKIHEEQHFIGDYFTNMSFQDIGAPKRLNYYIKRLANQIKRTNQSAASENTGSFGADKEESPMDIVKSIIPGLSSDINPLILAQVFSDPESSGYVFLNSDGEKIENPSLLDELRDVKFYSQINNKNLYSVLSSVPKNSFSMFEDEMDKISETVKDIQQKTIEGKSSNILNAQDYDLQIQEFISYEPVDADNYKPRFQIVGYLIEKIEITNEGLGVVRDPIIIENPTISSTVDVKIKYGTTYKYMIRSIALFETIAENATTNQNLVVKYLVASKSSPISQIECIEKVPPPEPSDLNLRWDFVEKCLVVEWAFPPNPQRDIKGWQILRRKNINEPYELIKYYDFDDSVIKVHDSQAETPDDFFTETMTSPKNYYIDKEFNKDSKYVYAICSVDARGLSSNYSTQMEATFDKFKNRVVKKLISVKGAPKIYPNYFLNQDTFVDSIKDSGHGKLKIYFSPEYLKVLTSNNDDLKLLRTKPNGVDKYQLSIINLDLQIQENIDITIADRTSTENKSTESLEQKRLLQDRRDNLDRLRKQRSSM
jgi:hypothetical protein